MSSEQLANYLKSVGDTVFDLISEFKPSEFSNSNQIIFVKHFAAASFNSEEENRKIFLKLFNKEKTASLVKFIQTEFKELRQSSLEIEQIEGSSAKKLLRIDWRLVSEITEEKEENMILLNFQFSDGSEQTVKTDFASFAKLQSDVEDATKAFNKSYTRKIINFAK